MNDNYPTRITSTMRLLFLPLLALNVVFAAIPANSSSPTNTPSVQFIAVATNEGIPLFVLQDTTNNTTSDFPKLGERYTGFKIERYDSKTQTLTVADGKG